MAKGSKFPMYVVGHKNGTITKIKSQKDLSFYREMFGLNFTEFDHHPTREEIDAVVDK